MNAKNSEAALHNVPLIISEFGSCSNSDDCTQDINNVLDVCEESLTGWAYNQFKQNKDFSTDMIKGFYEESGELQTSKVIALSRPY